jgi:hypothetical protein
MRLTLPFLVCRALTNAATQCTLASKSRQIVLNRGKSCFACCQVDLRGLDMEQMWDYVELSGTEACQIPAIPGISGIFRDIPG